MADKRWPNIINQFQNITPTPQRTVAGELLRFIVWGMAILLAIRILVWIASF